VLGGLTAAVTLAFSAPFWLASTRLYPYTFDIALFLLILNLLFSYDQRERLISLFLGTFLLAVCCLESPCSSCPAGRRALPAARAHPERASDDLPLLSLLLVGLAGVVVAIPSCGTRPRTARRSAPWTPSLLQMLQFTFLRELLRWIPRRAGASSSCNCFFHRRSRCFVFTHAFASARPDSSCCSFSSWPA
jgi:hypothetical protein